MQFWQPYCFFFRQKSRNCSLSFRKWLKNKMVFSNNPAQKTSSECRKGNAQCARMLKSIFFVKKIPILILWTHQKQFSQRCRNIFARGSKFLAHFWIRTAHTQFFQQNIFFPSFLVETYNSVLAILLEVFWPKTEKIAQKVKFLKNIHFFRKNFIEMILGTCRILFLQAESFCSLSKNDKMFFFQQILL